MSVLNTVNPVTKETPEQELARLRAENAQYKAQANRPLTLKVSEKGALSAYGLGRFPTTLYKEQWLKLLTFVGAPAENPITTFIKANPQLKAKGE